MPVNASKCAALSPLKDKNWSQRTWLPGESVPDIRILIAEASIPDMHLE